MQKTKYIWQNGEFILWDDATIHTLSHGLHYGSGAIDGIRCYNSDGITWIRNLDQHVDRFYASTQAISLALPITPAAFKQIIIDLLIQNQLKEGYIRPFACYGYDNLKVSTQSSPCHLSIACWPWENYHNQNGLKVTICDEIRLGSNTTRPKAKLTGQYINRIMGGLQHDTDHEYAPLLLDDQGYIAEGVSENFFMVVDDTLLTPKPHAILPGITRHLIMVLATQAGYQVEEYNIKPEMIHQASEAFFVGTAAQIVPILSIDQQPLLKNAPITSHLQSLYHDHVMGKTALATSLSTILDWRKVQQPVDLLSKLVTA